MPSLTSSAVLSPSDLVDYMDTGRAMELLCDEGEVAEGDDYPLVADIDTNARAIKLCNAAWYTVQMACRRGDIYGKRELIDLANDTVRGQPLIELVANIFWCKLIKRRRYVASEPQGEEASCKEAEVMLEQLQSGHRIFVLDGVTMTNSAGTSIGTYDNVMGPPTALSVGIVGSDTTYDDPLNRFFKCTNWPRTGSGGSRGCC